MVTQVGERRISRGIATPHLKWVGPKCLEIFRTITDVYTTWPIGTKFGVGWGVFLGDKPRPFLKGRGSSVPPNYWDFLHARIETVTIFLRSDQTR